ncbi:DNA polymerase IV [Streptomyces filamentosus]|uniref:DNA polymerase IV n=1 Tax=Streptomyces filamentosus TaxID=67294 RepID=UPI0037CF1C5B
MRAAPTILHLDMDAFFAAAEQASKPSLRGKPVVVGGLGPRGVVATASYEARRFGVHSAMPMGQARRLAPHAAYLVPRFAFYRAISGQVMELLGRLSPLVEPLSLDEAFVDLEAGGLADDSASARRVGERLRAEILATTGLTGSVGLAGSKMLAKIASEQAKPDGLVLFEPGTERELLAPRSVRIVPGVGPATGDHLRRAGISTVADVVEAGEDELVRILGRAHGASLYRMALGHDDRPVVAERDAKSVSVEDTFDVDLHDRLRIRLEVERLAERCVARLRASGHSGRTIVLKVRRYDFSTLTRSETLRGPTDDPLVVREAAERLLELVDTTGGVRLLGVGVSGLADYTQEDLFAQAEAEAGAAASTAGASTVGAGSAAKAAEDAADAVTGSGADAGAGSGGGAAGAGDGTGPEGGAEGAGGLLEAVAAVVPRAATEAAARLWSPGNDVRHAVLGAGWVQGSGLGRVTVRFEEPTSTVPGRVRTFAVDDPELEPADPLPLVAGGATGAEPAAPVAPAAPVVRAGG